MNQQTLLTAAGEGRLYDVKDQVKVGTDVNSEGEMGRIPLYYASWKDHLEVVKCLVEEGKADVDNAMHFGIAALKAAKYFNKEEIVKYLKGKGAKEGVPRAARVPDPAPSRCARSS
jgi:ankyrin repeat protein